MPTHGVELSCAPIKHSVAPKIPDAVQRELNAKRESGTVEGSFTETPTSESNTWMSVVPVRQQHLRGTLTSTPHISIRARGRVRTLDPE